MVGVLGRWGDDSQLQLVLDIINSLYRHSENLGAGQIPYLNIRSYPAVLVFTAYGLGLTRSERWQSLHFLFSAMIPRESKKPRRIVDELFLQNWIGVEEKTWWNQMKGNSRRTPLSDRLLGIFTEWGKSFAGLSPDFELMYERFEVLGSLVHIEQNDKGAILLTLKNPAPDNFTWIPIGRAGWHLQNREKLTAEIGSEPMKTALVAAGFGKGDAAFVELFITNFKQMSERMRW
jgi:hypothetical protein